MSVIVTADTHWEMRQRDEYRWRLLPWLAEQQADEIVFCGDLTGPKDGHPAKLVNRLADAMAALAETKRLWIVAGNHDAVDPATPFFRFLRNTPGIGFVTDSTVVELSIGRAVLVPAGVGWDAFRPAEAPFLFTHATFSGSRAENGSLLTGVDPRVLDGYDGVTYAGDVHVPQVVSRRPRIVSVGAPYHVKFGDAFRPRLIRLTDDGDEEDLFFPAPRKVVVSITRPEQLREEDVEVSDQVKVRCYLRRSEYVSWREYQREIRIIADELGWVLCGTEPVASEIAKSKKIDEVAGYVSPVELMEAYAKRKKVGGKHLSIGKKLLTGAVEDASRA